MKPYIQPAIERVPSNVILHCGTNDLETCTDPEQNVGNLINLAKSMERDKNNQIISELTPQNDELHKKAKEINEILARE